MYFPGDAALPFKLAPAFCTRPRPVESARSIYQGAMLIKNLDSGGRASSDGILLKPGALTDEEWEAMRKHPQFAWGMLSPID